MASSSSDASTSGALDWSLLAYNLAATSVTLELSLDDDAGQPLGTHTLQVPPSSEWALLAARTNVGTSTSVTFSVSSDADSVLIARSQAVDAHASVAMGDGDTGTVTFKLGSDVVGTHSFRSASSAASPSTPTEAELWRHTLDVAYPDTVFLLRNGASVDDMVNVVSVHSDAVPRMAQAVDLGAHEHHDTPPAPDSAHHPLQRRERVRRHRLPARDVRDADVLARLRLPPPLARKRRRGR